MIVKNAVEKIAKNQISEIQGVTATTPRGIRFIAATTYARCDNASFAFHTAMTKMIRTVATRRGAFTIAVALWYDEPNVRGAATPENDRPHVCPQSRGLDLCSDRPRPGSRNIDRQTRLNSSRDSSEQISDVSVTFHHMDRSRSNAHPCCGFHV